MSFALEILLDGSMHLFARLEDATTLSLDDVNKGKLKETLLQKRCGKQLVMHWYTKDINGKAIEHELQYVDDVLHYKKSQCIRGVMHVESEVITYSDQLMWSSSLLALYLELTGTSLQNKS